MDSKNLLLSITLGNNAVNATFFIIISPPD
jgi:hypothetical protein